MEPEEGVAGEQGQGTPESVQDQPYTEPVEDVVEGFEQNEDEGGTPAQAAPAEPGAESEEETAPQAKAPEPDPVTERVKSLEAQLHDLNRALHHERQKAKEAKQPEAELTDEQLVNLMKEHGDDPATMLNIMKYAGQQAAKKAGKEQADVAQVSQLKHANDQYVAKKWPEIYTNPAVKAGIDQYKSLMRLTDHPMADHLAASAWVADNLEAMQREWYDRGINDGLKGKVDKARKDNIALKAPAPAAGRQKATAGPKLSGTANETFKQMGLSKGAAEIAARLIAKKKPADMVEA